MILYHPLDSEIFMKQIRIRPKTCFLMTKIGKPIPDKISNMRKTIKKYLKEFEISFIDADSERTGRDFLLKIWEMIVSVPLGIAIISEELDKSTLANIFYEIGILQTLGKETLIVKSLDCKIPSDFVRTEYIEFERGFKREIKKYLKTFFKQADHYDNFGSELNSNIIVTIDYLRRAYLMTGDEEIKNKLNRKIIDFFDLTNFDLEVRNDVKKLLVQ